MHPDDLQYFGKTSDLIEKIRGQWQIIHLVKWNTRYDTVKLFWSEVLNYRNGDDQPFKDLAEFCLELLILPHTNAEVEGLFSVMNIIKSKLRNKLQLPMFSAILSIKAGLNRCDKCNHSYRIPENVHVTDTVGFSSEVNEYQDATSTNPFKELSDSACSMLLLSYSNAEVERVFSVMNTLKSILRNKMKINMVSAVLNIRSGHSCTIPDRVNNIVGTMQLQSTFSDNFHGSTY
nr:unnamed protein product [Callosobruchus analis]